MHLRTEPKNKYETNRIQIRRDLDLIFFPLYLFMIYRILYIFLLIWHLSCNAISRWRASCLLERQRHKRHRLPSLALPRVLQRCGIICSSAHASWNREEEERKTTRRKGADQRSTATARKISSSSQIPLLTARVVCRCPASPFFSPLPSLLYIPSVTDERSLCFCRS